MSGVKPFTIPKDAVVKAWEKVKKNAGSHGVDQQSIEDFEKNLKDNLYKVWNRLSSGSYFPPPVRGVEIPKSDGKFRMLGIPTVSDRIAQTIVRDRLEEKVEPIFHADSYAYRPRKSALDAVETVKQRSWKYNWVLEFDIKGAFDNINHDLMMRAVRFHTDCHWTILYVERWLKAPIQHKNGEIEQRINGTPQGGVVSPLIFNLYFHYAFDLWMTRKFPNIPFVRYADDGLLHCVTKSQAEMVKRALSERMKECGCELHPEKTKVVYCRDGNRKATADVTQFDFLGFNFRGRLAKSGTGVYFNSFNAAISKKSKKRILGVVREWNLARWTDGTLKEIGSKVNAVISGWWNYYGKNYESVFKQTISHINRILVKWATRKYKRFKGSRRKASEWLSAVAKQNPSLLFHWRIGVLQFG